MATAITRRTATGRLLANYRRKHFYSVLRKRIPRPESADIRVELTEDFRAK